MHRPTLTSSGKPREARHLQRRPMDAKLRRLLTHDPEEPPVRPRTDMPLIAHSIMQASRRLGPLTRTSRGQTDGGSVNCSPG
jgi:hypothetical protein